MILDQNLGQNALTLLSELFRRPIVDVNRAADVMSTSFATANSVVRRLEGIGILKEITGQKRFRKYRYEPYVALFEEVEEVAAGPPETTTGS